MRWVQESDVFNQHQMSEFRPKYMIVADAKHHAIKRKFGFLGGGGVRAWLDYG